MTGFKIETTTSAEPGARETLKAIEAGVGFVPHIYGVFAGAPTALAGLVALNASFSETAFSPAEQEVIALTTSVFNQCPYCVAGHSTFALNHGVDPACVDAMRAGGVSIEPRYQALGRFTQAVLENRGALGVQDVAAFLNAGFQTTQILELLLGVAGKTMTNFASKIARTPLDDAFLDQAWEVSGR